MNVVTFLRESFVAYGGECTICIQDIPFYVLAQTDCNHNFHLYCLEEHVRQNASFCPNCRSEIKNVSTLRKASWRF